ncbi:conserved exported hypothetical protein [Vibrio chagasii]|uniref:hypothetical protein n=1 Tax=Vibrio TaxID=662 RepID=UPI000CF46757|nr:MULTISPECIES: hypothetical protein [Vibrio]CAH6910596.1 conserved exported hypothetical protein [Vibrio chagasii]NOI94300.1 hypothetical protein [Vibrio sp. T3Y01]PQJ56531.1 hypothetical protein BTO12_02965 [Vibrio splendidus]CAH6921457.1 conserved exported hypothetical protein [Vibrio chagasii]CAH7101022.1 conserved exported hypothetical protein [Vibrio chagasii]
MKILILLLLVISTSSIAGVSIDGRFDDWESLSNEKDSYFTQVKNEIDYVHIAFSQPNNSGYIPIINGDTTFFIPITGERFVTYLKFGVNIRTGGSNDHDSQSDLKITLNNGVPDFKFISSINNNYLNDIKYKTINNDGLQLTEITIPKRLFGKHTKFQDVTVISQYKSSIFPNSYSTDSRISSMSRKINSMKDFSDYTITVGGSLSGFGANAAFGLAADDFGLGGYFDTTAGDTDFGISLDVGLFQGDVTDLNGTTIGGSVPTGIGLKYEHPVTGDPSGAGITLSFGIKGNYVDVPDMQITYGQAGYIITNDDVVDMFESNSSGNNNQGNDWSSDNDSWGHDDDHGPSYGGNDNHDWSHDDDDNAGYFG